MIKKIKNKFINYIIQRKAIKQPLSIKGRLELKKDDLRLARIIIFQLIWGKKYHDVCYSIKKSWEQIKNELPNLYELFNVRNYNLEDLVLYFSDMNNILKIWKKTMN